MTPESSETPTPATHEAAECKRINSSVDFHTKSYSYRFVCLTCGKSRRYNTNFLGNRYRLVCDGKRIVRQTTIVVGTLGAAEVTWTDRAIPLAEEG